MRSGTAQQAYQGTIRHSSGVSGTVLTLVRPIRYRQALLRPIRVLSGCRHSSYIAGTVPALLRPIRHRQAHHRHTKVQGTAQTYQRQSGVALS